MRKWIAFLCALCLLAGCTAWADTLTGQTVPDFQVTVTDGQELSLSELLKEKELVVLNVFATWCGPCAREFPEMEAVYQQYSDRIEILALSGYAQDTLELITDYKAYFGLSFPMGRMENAIDPSWIRAYPTTMVVGRDGTVKFSQVGAFASAEAFETVLKACLDDDLSGGRALYTFAVADEDGYGVEGAYLNVCTDTDCHLLQTDKNGLAFLFSEPTIYHVQLIRVPDGFTFDAGKEYYTGLESDMIIIYLGGKIQQ